MKILFITDIHGNINQINKLQRYFINVDIIIIGGDITNFGHNKDAQNIINSIYKLNKNIFAITGNCDYPEIEDYLYSIKININKNIKKYNDITIVGISGSLTTPFNTPNEYTKIELIERIQHIKSIISTQEANNNLLLVTHQPPINTINDTINNKLKALGSSTIRTFIEEMNPMLCLTGHIHEGKGIDKINNTKIINPGSLLDGNFCIINKNKYKINIQLNKL